VGREEWRFCLEVLVISLRLLLWVVADRQAAHSNSSAATKFRTLKTQCRAELRDSAVGRGTALQAEDRGFDSRWSVLRFSRTQWPSGLRRWFKADRFLGLRVLIPPGAWMFVL
jgi:hypothetical protein